MPRSVSHTVLVVTAGFFYSSDVAWAPLRIKSPATRPFHGLGWPIAPASPAHPPMSNIQCMAMLDVKVQNQPNFKRCILTELRGKTRGLLSSHQYTYIYIERERYVYICMWRGKRALIPLFIVSFSKCNIAVTMNWVYNYITTSKNAKFIVRFHGFYSSGCASL